MVEKVFALFAPITNFFRIHLLFLRRNLLNCALRLFLLLRCFLLQLKMFSSVLSHLLLVNLLLLLLKDVSNLNNVDNTK